MTACAVRWISAAASEWNWGAPSRRLAVILFLLLSCVWPNVTRLNWAAVWDFPHFDPDSPLVRAIQRSCGPAGTMVVWGWRSELHVASNCRPGTRFPDSIPQLQNTPNREYFRNLYVEDFQSSRPAVFVDSVGPGGFSYTDPAVDGHETFPALKRLIDRDYTPLGELDGARVYLRK
jgi:hypothetical protein